MKDKVDNIVKIICIVCIIGALVAFLFIYYGHNRESFVYEDHLQENVLTVRDSQSSEYQVSVNLQEMTYYVINVEGDINDMAKQYNSDNLEAYWRVKLEGTYSMRTYAKELAYDSCVRDNVYYLEALKAGVELTDEERKQAKDDAKAIMESITSKALGASDFTVEVLYNIEEKLYLSAKYVDMLSREGHTMEELELEGSFYEELLKEYSLETNNELWDKVRFGSITIEN